MKLMRFFIFAGLFIGLTGTGMASASKRFRLGRVMAAEISTRAVKVNSLNKHAFAFSFSKKAYAVVTVELDPDRTLSIYDFSLSVDGKKYPSIALRAGHGEFNGAKWLIKKSSPDNMYSMLFIVNGSGLGKTKTIEAALLYNLSDKGLKKMPLTMKYLGGKSITTTANIPENGMLAKKEKKVIPDKTAKKVKKKK